SLWNSFPNLNFEISPSEPVSETSLPAKSALNSLSSSPTPYYADYERYKNHVNSWLLCTVNSNVRELDFNFDIDIVEPSRICGNLSEFEAEIYDIREKADDGFILYSFNFSKFMNSSVKILKLRGCFLSLPAATGVSSLKSLYLSGMDLNGEIERIILYALISNSYL
ncbi:hypothetical protein ACH5RR_028998, partial [Cinchona calisaya]